MEFDAETRRKQLENVRQHRKELEEEERKLSASLGQGSGDGGVVAAAEEREKLADLYDRMLPGERTKLYMENRGYFDRLLKAVEERGIQKLLHPE